MTVSATARWQLEFRPESATGGQGVLSQGFGQPAVGESSVIFTGTPLCIPIENT